MNYREHKNSELATTARISHFKPEGGIGEYHVMVTCHDSRRPYAQQAADALATLKEAEAMMSKKAAPVFKRYFLSDAANQAYKLPKDEPCAVSVIGQAPLNGTKIAIWAIYQEDMDVRRLPSRLYRADHGHYAHIWGGGMCAPDLSSEVATIAMLGDYSNSLQRMGCSLADNCLRTWLFVHDVDINYRGVVHGRNEVFRCSGLTLDSHFIASTGIGGINPNPNVTVTLDTYAIKGIAAEQIKYLHAPTHLNPTYEYGVSFERGTAIDYGDRRHVLISGTASINNKGEVMYPGDIVRQTARMIENVEALLRDGEATWDDVAHAIVYLRDPSDYDVVSSIIAERLPQLPAVFVLAPVCRTSWLVELECMAIAPHSSSFPAL